MKKKIWRLEAVRGFAALYVVLHHIRGNFDNKFIQTLLSFGQEAVILFFLLSGFVIFYSVRDINSLNFSEYLIKRLRRIYPIFLAALGIAYIAALVKGNNRVHADIATALGNIFMLQDEGRGRPGVWFDVFSGNSPLWSLSYEVWFYMLFFPISKFVNLNKQKVVVFYVSLSGTLLFFLLPNQISIFFSYFIIWWCGVELARQYRRDGIPTLSGQTTMLLLLLCVGVLWAANAILEASSYPDASIGTYPYLQVRHFFVAFFFVLVSLLWARAGFLGFHYVFGSFRSLAPVSYGIYLFHYPIVATRISVTGIMKVICVISLMLFTYVLAYLFEVIIQGKINKITDRLMQRKTGKESVDRRLADDAGGDVR